MADHRGMGVNTKIDSAALVDAPHQTQDTPKQVAPPIYHRSTSIELIAVICLALAALVPRLLLALQLDMVTDEVVYIPGGKIYFPLLTHLNIGASQWAYNYEHPPFVKLLIGLSLSLNAAFGHPLSELLTARIPSIIMGTLLIVALYWLGKAPFGRVVALVAALSLAVSPWLVYFSALAYLDMTMTALITVASLLIWHAIQRPWLYLLAALLIGLGADSKYTAVFVVPGMVLFTAHYFFIIRPHIPTEQRPRIPWLWWLAAIIVAPLTFLITDPAIWPHPLSLLLYSFSFEWNHSYNGHLTFIAGRYDAHVPHWAILYVLIAKISAFVTIPSALFCILAPIQLVLFHRGKITAAEATAISFLCIWLVSMLGMFSLLTIMVGTHYYLPLAAPVALAGASGLALLLRYRRGSLLENSRRGLIHYAHIHHARVADYKVSVIPYGTLIVALLASALVIPHLIGLTSVYAAEGYTSEFFPNENAALQVAYPGYREAVQWIAANTHGTTRIGLVALLGTLSGGSDSESWYSYNRNLPARLHLTEAHPGEAQYQYDYLIWPMHLVQRGYAIPASWHARIVHVVMGGSTVYCYVLAHPKTSL